MKKLDENYIVINGKKAELTEEQLERLGIKVKKKNYFERVKHGDKYWTIHQSRAMETYESGHFIDERAFNTANYCTDAELMEQRALHEFLNRLLWRFSCENGELDNPWDEIDPNENWDDMNRRHKHWEIIFDDHKNEFHTPCWSHFKSQGTVYFPTKKIAQRAIDEIVKPFMKEHPDFVW